MGDDQDGCGTPARAAAEAAAFGVTGVATGWAAMVLLGWPAWLWLVLYVPASVAVLHLLHRRQG